MYLMKDSDGKYTLKKVGPDGKPTMTAHPGESAGVTATRLHLGARGQREGSASKP